MEEKERDKLEAYEWVVSLKFIAIKIPAFGVF